MHSTLAKPGTPAISRLAGSIASFCDVDTSRLNVAINVADFKSSLAFYRDKLDMRVLKEWDGEAGPGAILGAGRGRSVELFGPPYGARSFKQPASGVEMAFDVEDVNEWAQILTDRGVPIAREVLDNPWGDRSLGLDDPDGLRIWLVEITDPNHLAHSD